MITGILVALPEELRTLTNAKLKSGECINVAHNTLVILSGAGSAHASMATQKLIKKGAEQLISWGCAGALAPFLKAGDLLIPKSILTQDATQLATQQSWSKQIISTLESAIQCYDGSLFANDSVITLAEDKMHLYQTSKALAVDMESAALARVAQQAKVPFVVIRSIVDPADLDLPNAISHAMSDNGIVSIPKLVFYLCLHPVELPRLIKLGLHFHSASKTLKYVASQLVHITQVQQTQICQ